TRGTAAHLILQGGTSGSVGLTISSASNPFILYGGSTLNIALGASDTVTITNGGTTSAGLVSVGANVGTSTLVTLNGSDWAALNGSKQIVASSYTNGFATTSSSNLDVLASGTLTGSAVNTLRLNQSAPTTVTVNSASTSVNGVLVTSAVGNNTVTISGQSIRGANNQTMAVFQYNTAADLIINSTIVNQGTSGLVKAGGGRVVLTAANAYTGRTFVNEGTLLLNGGSISTGIVTVATNARLGGVGSVAGETFVSAGGVIQAGDGVAASGNLTFSSNLSFADGTRIELTLGAAGAHSSLVRGGGTWAFDSDQAFTFVFSNAAAGAYDNIISGLTGSEAGLATIGTWTITNAGAVGTFSYDGAGGVDLTMSAIPEPSTWALLALASAGLAAFGRKVRRRNC
ncbi:MAG TPA: autotransporter-associated beta strand repeat-containing protein, partial [Terrimicrobiaceae bacterium]|nr:autotransporter-associated beta strand repeat-containing protein [Terrimicrobiaceae bacterium]